jgi:hypothetical protein
MSTVDIVNITQDNINYVQEIYSEQQSQCDKLLSHIKDTDFNNPIKSQLYSMIDVYGRWAFNIRGVISGNGEYYLFTAKYNNSAIGYIWVIIGKDLRIGNNHCSYIVGITSTVSYLIAKQKDNTLPRISSILIPEIIKFTQDKKLQYIAVTPLENMRHILCKYYNFKLTDKKLYGNYEGIYYPFADIKLHICIV